MDAKSILDSFLQTGKQYAEQGKNLAEDKLGLPEEGAEREAMLGGMGKGALAAGALALLLGTGAGRRLTGTALKVGSLAAIGSLAFKTYQGWQEGQGGETSGTPVNSLFDDAANDRSITLVRAMIAAAKVDGHIDSAEQQRINEQIHKMNLDDSTFAFLKNEIEKPLDVSDIASQADSTETAAEIYLASLLVIEVDKERERQYLNDLAKALNLPDELASQLEEQVAQA